MWETEELKLILINLNDQAQHIKDDIRNSIFRYDVKFIESYIFYVFDEDKALIDFLEEYGILIKYDCWKENNGFYTRTSSYRKM